MIFEFKNVGMIKAGTINIDGLVVIAGVNDSGKSTIGRLIFSIIKAI
jgi:predicted ATPase